MNILVTGGCGFIGSHLVDRLIELNHKVIVLDNLSTGNIFNLNHKATLYEIDIRNKTLVDELFQYNKFDIVFHLAAQINLRESIRNPHVDADSNVIGTINILNNCVGIRKFIFTSTGGAIYAPNYNTLPWQESDETNPQSPYGLSKFCAEKYIDLLSKSLSFPYTILRLSNVYGPRQNAHGEAGVIAIFKERIDNNIQCTIFGNGYQTRDFVYVADVVNAFIAAMDEHVSGIFNVSTESEVAINDLTYKMFSILRKEPNIVYADAITGELARSCLSYQKLFKATGWKPQHTFSEGLLETLKD